MSQQNIHQNATRSLLYHNKPAPQHNIGSSSSPPNMNLPSYPIHPFGGENAVRIMPGPAGILQAAKLCKTTEIMEGSHNCEMPTREYVRKITEEASEDDHFTYDPWHSAVQYVAVEGSIIIGCFGDTKTFCKNGKLENVVAVIKSCTPNVLGDLTVTLKDLSGAVLILRNVSVFSPKSLGRYLSITLKTLLRFSIRIHQVWSQVLAHQGKVQKDLKNVICMKNYETL
uniref:Uncharacterized protein n=1 Tax=Tanacetum cinerariifolium TaxID=118510 RepID=A0A6L2MAI8_TANCI|nr:hypothetical protein [Tanacetum cinerariifolium]